jgi:hypothetical protein
LQIIKVEEKHCIGHQDSYLRVPSSWTENMAGAVTAITGDGTTLPGLYFFLGIALGTLDFNEQTYDRFKITREICEDVDDDPLACGFSVTLGEPGAHTLIAAVAGGP